MWDKNFKGRYVLIEPTDYCNCDCIMCTRALLGVENPHFVPKGFMDFKVFKSIIDGLEFGQEPVALKLFWIGESLLHPDFKKMLEYASKKLKGTTGYIDLHTNGHLLVKEMADFMLGLGKILPRITFSIDAFHSETHKKIRRGGGLKKVMENIRYLIEAREKSFNLFPRVVLQFIIMEENKAECKQFVDYWSNFLIKKVKLNLADAWPALSKKRKLELLRENGILKEYENSE